ncbi:MAG: hypothetical protein SFU25_04795, partial [Candidatus Caenarcaniphilales bacterium]|nr:hypothetical protein [Candidatus Caenarcaniphilales bacterium]
MNLSVNELKRIARQSIQFQETLIKPWQVLNAAIGDIEKLPRKFSKWQPKGMPKFVESKSGNLILLKEPPEEAINSGNYGLYLLNRADNGIFN